MKEVLCVNDTFDSNTLNIYKKYGVVQPIKDSLYNIRSIFKYTTGQVGILLEELHNPPIKYKHPIIGDSFMEPTWNINRFRTLSGDGIDEESIREMLNNSNLIIKETYGTSN